MQVLWHAGVSGVDKGDTPSLGLACEGVGPDDSALAAVESVVRALENDPLFNAGLGAVVNRDGELELDAGIVDGVSGRCGAVANVLVRNPISLARRVLETTPHVLVTGRGAMALADDMERLDGPTPEQRARWERARDQGRLGAAHYGRAEHVETVGAVALDDSGRLAAGSSTGGVFGKLPGRVGDAPIMGAGIYASTAAAAVGTGVGELFLETLAAFRAGRAIEDGEHPQTACERMIALLGRRERATAGLVALDRRGRCGAAYRGGALQVRSLDGALRAACLGAGGH
jgi:beta-aspartyl-peptidase (threonine type)